jgi:two-component system NtrC family sensor kinase
MNQRGFFNWIPARFKLPQLISSMFIIAVSLSLSILGSTMIYWNHQEIDQELNQFLLSTSQNLQGSLEIPVWNLDQNSVESIFNTYLEQEGSPLLAIQLSQTSFFNDLNFLKKGIEAHSILELENEKAVRSRTTDIFHHQQKIGSLKIFASAEKALSDGRFEMYKILGIFIFSFILLSYAVLRFLDVILTRPLRNFTTALQDAKNAKYQIEVATDYLGELREIAQEFNQAIQAIGERDQRLQGYASKLEGQVAQGVILLEDQKVRAENSARLAALGEMSDGIAHEINNPLAVILSASERMLSIVESPRIQQSDLAKEVQRIEKMVARISKIVTSLRSFARDGSQDPMRSFCISTIFNEIKDVIGAKLAHRGIGFEVKASGELQVFGNEVQISQVLINLVNNSVDAIEDLKDRWLRLEAVDKGSVVEISVTDSGPGIPAEVAKKIFQPFFTTKEVGKGTGLGLSIAHGIVENHRGHLELDANSLNTRFVFELSKKDFSV